MLTLTVGTNSYCTLLEAEAYHETRFGNDLWIDQFDDDKIRALIGACSKLETINWIGDKTSHIQLLQWPRVISFQRTMYNSQTSYSTDSRYNVLEVSELPKHIIYAQAELAFQLLKGYLANSSVTDLKVGSLQIKTNNLGMFPLEVENFISPYVNRQPRLIRT
jgi:hypothetical protein